ncbi:hypothetical protein [Flagellimonas olearia]|nr:hypothetical protein [Allomuricauda olearia]
MNISSNARREFWFQAFGFFDDLDKGTYSIWLNEGMESNHAT